MSKCTAVTRKGSACPIEAGPSGLCHVHDPALQCGAVSKGGKRCAAPTGGVRCAKHAQPGEVAAGPVAPRCPECGRQMHLRPWRIARAPKGIRIATCKHCSLAAVLRMHRSRDEPWRPAVPRLIDFWENGGR